MDFAVRNLVYKSSALYYTDELMCRYVINPEQSRRVDDVEDHELFESETLRVE